MGSGSFFEVEPAVELYYEDCGRGDLRNARAFLVHARLYTHPKGVLLEKARHVKAATATISTTTTTTESPALETP